MIGKLLVFALVIGAILVAQRWWRQPQRSKKQRLQMIGALIALALVLLALTGKLNPLLAAVVATLALSGKILEQLLRYWPLLDQMRGAQGGDANGGDPGNGTMTVEQARQILGLGENVSRDDIVQAHRRLIQKMHPDRGGSDYLAAQINLAKDTLLKNL